MGARLHLPAVTSTLLPVALGILTLLPHILLGKPAEEESAGSSPLLQRVKRSWVWNQFFVLEEYTGLEPLYIGKVSVHYMLYCIYEHIYCMHTYKYKAWRNVKRGGFWAGREAWNCYSKIYSGAQLPAGHLQLGQSKAHECKREDHELASTTTKKKQKKKNPI